MQIGPFALTLTRPTPITLDLRPSVQKDAVGVTQWPSEALVGGGSHGGGSWWSIREVFAGAWQRGIRRSTENILTHATVYSCVTLIASDIGKLCVELMQRDPKTDIWTPTVNASYSPVLRKPNHYQNRIKFFEQWVLSKLIHGNAYILKERDNRNVVTDLYVLDPTRVQVLVAPDGSVFYQLNADYLSGLSAQVTVPASEIIHDVMNALYHPLCGISPIAACGLPAIHGLNIQEQSSQSFANQLNPGGVLTAPNHIPPDTAARLQKHWEEHYAGPQNVGRVAVLGDGLHFEKMMLTAVDAQLIDQLKWTSETVCSCFHVPPYMVSVGPPPNYNNIEALNQQYYSQCLQALIESLELCLEEGLGLGLEFGNGLGVAFDLDGLLRMDSATKMKTATDGVNGGVMSPNEARKKFNLQPVPGGDAPYLQQQNYSLEALAKRDAADDPFATVRETFTGAAPPPPTATGEPSAKALVADLVRELRLVVPAPPMTPPPEDAVIDVSGTAARLLRARLARERVAA